MRRILVVEDNPDLAFGLRNNLEIEGYEVSVAHDGTTALSLAEEAKPDLIIRISGFRILTDFACCAPSGIAGMTCRS
jgi:DNA-binding response OmpR family regulator